MFLKPICAKPLVLKCLEADNGVRLLSFYQSNVTIVSTWAITINSLNPESAAFFRPDRASAATIQVELSSMMEEECCGFVNGLLPFEKFWALA
jgi:hypothetical protein